MRDKVFWWRVIAETSVCLPKAPFFFVFLFQWRVSFMASHSTVHFVPSAQNKNTVDWILDSLHHPSLLPAALLSANSVCVSERDRDACVLCVHTRVLKVNYCKRLPINLKFERYCRTYKLINTCANIMLSHKHTVSYTHTHKHTINLKMMHRLQTFVCSRVWCEIRSCVRVWGAFAGWIVSVAQGG